LPLPLLLLVAVVMVAVVVVVIFDIEVLESQSLLLNTSHQSNFIIWQSA
jgi:hypothetical protein